MTRNQSQNGGPAGGDIVRDDRADEDPKRRGRRSPSPVGVGEPAVPMSPTPRSGPLGDETEDPVEPSRPPGETIR